MEQQRYASLSGRARELLPTEELEPDPKASRDRKVRSRSGFTQVPVQRQPLARLGEVLEYKSSKSSNK